MYLCKVVAMPSPVVEEVESVTRPSRVELFEEEQSDLTRLKLKALVPQAQTLNTNLSKSDPVLYQALAAENAAGVLDSISRIDKLTPDSIVTIFETYTGMIQQKYAAITHIADADTERQRIATNFMENLGKIQVDALRILATHKEEMTRIQTDGRVKLSEHKKDTDLASDSARVEIIRIEQETALELKRLNTTHAERLQEIMGAIEIRKTETVEKTAQMKERTGVEQSKARREHNKETRALLATMKEDHKKMVIHLNSTVKELEDKGHKFHKTFSSPRQETNTEGYICIVEGTYELKPLPTKGEKMIDGVIEIFKGPDIFGFLNKLIDRFV